MTEREPLFDNIRFRTTEERSKFWRLVYTTWIAVQGLSTGTKAEDLWRWQTLPENDRWRRHMESLERADQLKIDYVTGAICRFAGPEKPLYQIIDPEFTLDTGASIGPKSMALLQAGFQGVGFEDEE